MPSRVFIIEPPRANISLESAKKFGALTVIFDHNQRRPSAFVPTEYVDSVIKRLKALGFDANTDYVCLAGSLLPNSLLVAAALCEWGTLLLLVFDATRSEYVDKVCNAPQCTE